MRKIAIVVGNSVYSYRKEFLERLARFECIDLYCSSAVQLHNINVVKCATLRVGQFRFQPKVLNLLCFWRYKKIIVVGNFNYVSNALLLCLVPKNRLVSWGFWETRSKLANLLRRYLATKCSTNLLYAPSHSNIIPEHKAQFLVARNTVMAEPKFRGRQNKNSLIFVGSLNARKRLIVFLPVFKRLRRLNDSLILDIIGDGPEKNELVNKVIELQLTEHVRFHGRITDSRKLSEFYAKAIIEISIGQAGLSVPMALGHGVPFATLSGAISGGETDSIIDNVTGFKKDSLSDLELALSRLVTDIELIELLSTQSRAYYEAHLSIDNMVDAFKEALCQ